MLPFAISPILIGNIEHSQEVSTSGGSVVSAAPSSCFMAVDHFLPLSRLAILPSSTGSLCRSSRPTDTLVRMSRVRHACMQQGQNDGVEPGDGERLPNSW